MKVISLLEDKALVEHLGNLDAVDKELVSKLVIDMIKYKQQQGIGWKKNTAPASGDTRAAKTLDTQAYARFSKTGKETWEKAWDDGDARNTNAVPNMLGRDSKLEERSVTAEEALKLLAEDRKYVALIYKRAGEQALIIVHEKHAIEDKKAVTASENAFPWKMTKRFHKLVSQLKLKTRTAYVSGEEAFRKALKLSFLAQESKTSFLHLKALLLLLARFEFTLQNPDSELPKKDSDLPKLDVTLVTVDEQRRELHSQRKKARKNYVPTPRTPVRMSYHGVKYKISAYDSHVRGLTDALAYKLNVLRNSRAVDFDNPEEMIKHVIDKGYLDKIKYLGQTYNLDKQNHIDYADLMLGKKSQEKSYIAYKLEDGLSWSDSRFKNAYKEMQEIVKSLEKDAPPRPDTYSHYKANEFPEGPEREQFLDNKWAETWAHDKAKPRTVEIYLKNKVPPNELKIKLRLEGGKIMPFMVELDFR